MATNTLLQILQSSQEQKNQLQVENSQIFYCLQNSLTNASLARLNCLSLFSSFLLLLLHQVFICGIYILPQLR